VEKVELSFYGQKLPINIPGVERTFSFKPWRMTEELKIGKLKGKKKGIGVFVRDLFTEMLDSFGGKKWDQYDDAAKRQILNSMPTGNVFYMYLQLRYEAVGKELNFGTVRCPHCQHDHQNFRADIGTTTIRVKEDEESREFHYKLSKPFTVGEVNVTEVIIGYTPWDCMERFDERDALNEGAVKQKFLSASIVGGVTEEAGRVKLDHGILVNNLSKRDLELLTKAVDDHNAGPIMGLELTCENCGQTNARPLNWTYDYFFSNSSL
jgi:ribosomal protein S27E